MLRFILLIHFAIVAHNGLSQSVLDSLRTEWKSADSPVSERLQALDKYIRVGFLFSNPDSAISLAEIEYDLAREHGMVKPMGLAKNIMGLAHYYQGQYPEALKCLDEAIKIQSRLEDKTDLGHSLNNMGSVYFDKGEFGQAISYYGRSLKILEDLGDQAGVSKLLNNIGMIHEEQKDSTKALEYYYKSLELKRKLDDEIGIENSLVNIGLILMGRKQNDSAMVCFNEALEIAISHNDRLGETILYNVFGSYFMHIGQKELGLTYLKKCLTLAEEFDPYSQANCLNNIGNYYMDQADSIGSSRPSGARDLYLKALDLFTQALELSQDLGVDLDIRDAALGSYKSLKALGRHSQALPMHELYVEVGDRIDSEENTRALLNQEYEYHYDKKRATDSVTNAAAIAEEKLKTEKEKEANARKSTQLWAAISGIALCMVLIFVAFSGYRRKKKDNILITEQKAEVEHQKHLVEAKNTEILDSIKYAKRLQEAILPTMNMVSQNLTDSFILYKPKDIVAGDFYWMEKQGDEVWYAVADCTGHGVPGAMVSVVCANALNRAFNEFGLRKPNMILDKVRELVVDTYAKSEGEVKDGMDVALVRHNLKSLKIEYAGANNPLWITSTGETSRLTQDQEDLLVKAPVVTAAGVSITEIKASKQPIGLHVNPQPFTNHELELQQGDCIYLSTDGFPDQFGGENGKKFKYKPFKRILCTVHDEPMEYQSQVLDRMFMDWKGNLDQVDDVCVMGVRI